MNWTLFSRPLNGILEAIIMTDADSGGRIFGDFRIIYSTTLMTPPFYSSFSGMIGGNLPSVSIVSQNEESEQYAALRCYKKMNPYLLLLCSGASLMFCSCSLVNPVGDWPLRTKDPSLSVVSNHFKLSDHDIQEIHQAVWSEFPEFRVLGIETIKADVVLITCTKQKGEKFSKLYGLDSKKSGGKWTLGNYRSNMSANNM